MDINKGGWDSSIIKLTDISLPIDTTITRTLTISKDNKFLAVAINVSPFIQIYLIDDINLTPLPESTLEELGIDGGIISISFSDDGKFMAIGRSISPFVIVYSISHEGFTRLPDLENQPNATVFNLTFSPDNRFLVFGAESDSQLWVYEINDNSFIKLPSFATLPSGQTRGIAFSPEGQFLVIGRSVPPYFHAYQISGNMFTAVPSTPSIGDQVMGISFSSDGAYMALVLWGGVMSLYTISGTIFTLRTTASLSGNYFYDVSFSPDGLFLAVSCLNSPFICLFRLRGYELIRMPNPSDIPPSTGYKISFSRDSRLLAVASNETLDVSPLTVYYTNADAPPDKTWGFDEKILEEYPNILGVESNRYEEWYSDSIWSVNPNILHGYPHNPLIDNTGYDEWMNENTDWGMADDVLDGYPHHLQIYDLVNFVDNYHIIKNTHWFVKQDILDGYPYSYYKELNPPYKLPKFDSVSLNTSKNFVGLDRALEIIVNNLKNIYLLDLLIVEVIDSQDVSVFYSEQLINQEGNIDSFSYTIPGSEMQGFAIGEYIISVFIKRTTTDYSAKHTSNFKIIGLPSFSVLSASPTTIMKPIDDDDITIQYRVLGEGIERITNTFTIDDNYSITQVKKPEEQLIIESNTEAARSDNTNFVFNVTDPNFILKSIKFKFGAYTSNTRIIYTINGTTYLDGNFNFPGWIEYVSPTGIPLPVGSRTINISCPPSYFYTYSTNTKPTVPGMTITSTTVYAMEMVYSVSSSNITGDQTIVLTLDNDDINAGTFPITYESEMLLEGGVIHVISGVTDDMLSISEMNLSMPEINIKSLSPNIIGKPIGADNSTVAINYEIINPDQIEIKEITNIFTIDKYSVTETKKPAELAVVESSALTSNIWNTTINFNVTDTAFKIISFKFYFGTYNNSVSVDFRIDGTTYKTFTSNNMPEGWYEHEFITPLALSVGAHSFTLYDQAYYYRMYSTTTRPTHTGFTWTSTTIYKMEMVYIISTSGINEENTCILTIGDDDIVIGQYPVSFESSMLLPKNLAHTTNGMTGNMFTIAKPLPTRDSVVSVSSTIGTAGNIQPLTVTFTDVQNTDIGDEYIVQIYDEDNQKIFQDKQDLALSSYANLSITVPALFLSSLSTNNYEVKTFIKREGFEHCIFNFIYLLEDISQNVVVSSVSPSEVQKTLIDKNNKIKINYDIIGNITDVSNTFTIDGYSVSENGLEFAPIERANVVSVATTSTTLTNFSLNINVTDSNLKLLGVRYLCDTTIINTNINYSVNGTVQNPSPLPYPTGISAGWIEFMYPEPISLATGTNTILLQSTAASGLRLWSTTTKPTVPGFTWSTTTVYTMELIYTISTTQNRIAKRDRSVKIILDDNILSGTYPLELNSTVRLSGSGNTHNLIRQIGSIQVLPRVDMEIGSVVLSYSGRYIGAETHITVNALGLDHIEAGDVVNVIFRNDETIFHQYSDVLSLGQTSYTYEVNTHVFEGLAAGQYRVEVEIKRGIGIVEAAATYDVIPTPTIKLTLANPNRILLPFSNPISLQTTWAITMAGHNAITGNIKIFNTLFQSIVNTESTGNTNIDLSISNITNLPANIYMLSYNIIVSSTEYGSVTLMDNIPNVISVYGSHLAAENRNFDIVFQNVNDLTEGVYSLKVNNLRAVNSQLGTVPIYVVYDNVLTATEVPIIGAMFDDVSTSLIGRYVGSEADNEIIIKLTDLENAEENDKIRIEIYKDTVIHYANEITILPTKNTYTDTILESVFASLPIGEYSIRFTIIRGTKTLDTRELPYEVIDIPTVQFVDVSEDYIELPIFMPIDIIAKFAVIGNNISSIECEAEFNDKVFKNNINNEMATTFSSSVSTYGTMPLNLMSSTEISIALRNIYEIHSGSYSIGTQFNIFSRQYGTASVTATFNNVITVPNIVITGAETKYIYDLILCRSNRQQIAFIECNDVVFNPMFLEYNKLNFSIYRDIVAEDGTVYLNPIWGKVLSDYQVELNIKINDKIIYTEYFVIENPALSYDGLDNLTFQAYSYEKVFINNTNLSGFKDSVKRLYDTGLGANYIPPEAPLVNPSPGFDADGLPHGFLNYILKQKWYNVWTLRHIDGSVLARERVLSFTGNNMKYVIDTLEESFNCVFIFDNVNMMIDIYERSIGMLGNNRGLVIADDNYMSTINYQEDTTGIKTRLSVFGKNQETIAKYNPTGQLYVDDFSYYMNLKYMRQELIDALTAYEALCASKTGVWAGYVDQMDAFDNVDPPVSSGTEYNELMTRIRALRLELAWENNFTAEQIRELVPFIKEDTVNINTISDGKELYKYAVRHIKTTAFVPTQITIDVPDVFMLEEHQKEWIKFRVGDFANIYRKEYDLIYKEMRLVSYEHNPIKNTLKLEFSNKDELITYQWLNNMFFYKLENMEIKYDGERDYYVKLPEFSYDDPKLIDIVQNIVDNSVTEVVENIYNEIDERVYNQITEVYDFKVLAADTVHILNAWIRYLCVDMVETNFEALDLRLPPPPNMLRDFIRIQGVSMEYITSSLSSFEIENYKTPFGDQIYWTSIYDRPQAYKYFTITDPIDVYPSTSLVWVPGTPMPEDIKPKEELTELEKEEIREHYRVKVRKTNSEEVKRVDGFEPLYRDGSLTTMIPKSIWGTGDPNGNIKGYLYKDWDSFNFTFTTAYQTGKTPQGTEIGIRIDSDGCWYWDIDRAEWKLIGSGDGGLIDEDTGELTTKVVELIKSLIVIVAGQHIIIDHLPTQAEINLYPVGAVVLVYDPNNPYVPLS